MKMTTRVSFLLLIAVLCTITLVSAQSFKETSVSHDSGPLKEKADNSLQGLTRRALAAFPKNEVADLFDNLNDGQSEQEILKNYYELSALTLKGRKASFRRASANNKSGLWRTHFALYLINHPELDERQKEVILAAMSLATPDYFSVRSNSPDWKTKVRERERSLQNQIFAAFPAEEAVKIFATLGDNKQAANPGPGSPSPVLLKSIDYKPLGDSGPYQQWTLTRFSQVVPENSCSCSTASDYCPIFSICRAGGCSETASGCGTLWSHPCNGACQ